MVTDNEIITLPYCEKYIYIIHGIMPQHNDDHYRKNCLHSFRIESKLQSHESAFKNRNHCKVLIKILSLIRNKNQ